MRYGLGIFSIEARSWKRRTLKRHLQTNQAIVPTHERASSRADYFSTIAYPLFAFRRSYTPERRTVRAGGGVDSSGIERLLESFATAALGAELGARIDDARLLPQSHQRMRAHADSPSQWCAWETARGPLTLVGRYDEVQSSLVRAHVLLLEWWIGDCIHHEGWWHCYAKFPRDWTKGAGRVNRW